MSAFSAACSNLVGQVAANQSLADSIVAALESGRLTAASGPVGISKVLKGAPGSHNLTEFIKTWRSSASHLNTSDVTAIIKSSLDCYSLARTRAHTVDTVWTGPEVAKSELRRTEAVVREIIDNAGNELLIVGYWLVVSTEQIEALIKLLVKKARAGVHIRFVFDPGDKPGGRDNFSALNSFWPVNLAEAPREVYSWSEHMTKTTSKSGQQYDRKLHAKVIIADRNDALVTSANLTHAGFLENLEMGLRIQGLMAGALVRHFDLLIEGGSWKGAHDLSEKHVSAYIMRTAMCIRYR
ncbi:DISARM system phospholipase D-like protein DrmC [Pseudomonas sp. 44 R 15]|uniref:DISARM system phospholipase D-like protein DrmC n=1 Tax=Pseudomonas sp. 44 R 15 TaxID=1844105 RepID=UPI00210BD2CA|nr:DISARM system phospholipase D-like protein DrmC [Pseudomonas sp. 44 R 15]